MDGDTRRQAPAVKKIENIIFSDIMEYTDNPY